MTTNRPYSDPEIAARKILEAIQDGRIHIEKINGPFDGYRLIVQRDGKTVRPFTRDRP